ASAQHAGNANYNGSYTPNLVPYAQPAGVNLNVTVAGYSYGNMVSLKGDVMINVLPSSYVIILSATQVNETFEKADSMMNLRFGILRNELKQLGITEQDVHIDFISNVPNYTFEMTAKKHTITGNEIAAGFELKKNIHINVKNIAQMDAIVAASAKAEVYDLVKVDYIVENMEQIYHQLRLKALEVIEMKKAPYMATGVKLKQLDLGETRGSVYPVERYARYTAYNSGTPAFYQKISSKQTVQVNYADKNQTVYYEKVPFNQFDHVINPNVEEPCVQFYFSLQVNFKIIDEEAEKRQKEDREYELKRREIELSNLKNPPVADKPKNAGKK
ncbi:MAG TPA: SIMPL domain-containing protein, partial [Bacteroidia bacterium]|nr:SIMPL domain-containing protein [Bacteroidia bacterium]